MNLQTILASLKAMIPVLEPLGEQGIAQLFQVADQEIAKMPNSDMKDFLTILSPAMKQFALVELKKLN